MSEKTTVKSGGIGVLGLLGIVFVVMKLAGIGDVASWSWWWVTLPFWGGFVLLLAFMAIVFLFAIIASIWSK